MPPILMSRSWPQPLSIPLHMPHPHTIRPQDSDGPQDLPFEQVQGNPGLMSAALVDRAGMQEG